MKPHGSRSWDAFARASKGVRILVIDAVDSYAQALPANEPLPADWRSTSLFLLKSVDDRDPYLAIDPDTIPPACGEASKTSKKTYRILIVHHNRLRRRSTDRARLYAAWPLSIACPTRSPRLALRINHTRVKRAALAFDTDDWLHIFVRRFR